MLSSWRTRQVGIKLIAVIAITLIPGFSAAADYLNGYIQSQGGSISYRETEPASAPQNVNSITIVIENNQAPYYYPNYYPIWPIFPIGLDTWRYGSPSDIRRWNLGPHYYQRHPKWQRR